MKNLGKIIIFSMILLILSLILILFRNQVIFIDESLFHAINGFSNPVLDIIFIPLTYFGSVFFWILVMIIAWIKKRKKLSVYLIYALIIDSILSLYLKWTFQRGRPDNFLKENILIERNFGSSFPSGHAERAFSGSIILSPFYNSIKFKTISYVLAILTGISRIYLGAHYPIDVLFGSLIGIISGNIILNLPTEKAQEKIENFVYEIRIFFQKL